MEEIKERLKENRRNKKIKVIVSSIIFGLVINILPLIIIQLIEVDFSIISILLIITYNLLLGGSIVFFCLSLVSYDSYKENKIIYSYIARKNMINFKMIERKEFKDYLRNGLISETNLYLNGKGTSYFKYDDCYFSETSIGTVISTGKSAVYYPYTKGIIMAFDYRSNYNFAYTNSRYSKLISIRGKKYLSKEKRNTFVINKDMQKIDGSIKLVDKFKKYFDTSEFLLRISNNKILISFSKDKLLKYSESKKESDYLNDFEKLEKITKEIKNVIEETENMAN